MWHIGDLHDISNGQHCFTESDGQIVSDKKDNQSVQPNTQVEVCMIFLSYNVVLQKVMAKLFQIKR